MPSAIFPFHTFRRKSTVGVNSKLGVKGIEGGGGGVVSSFKLGLMGDAEGLQSLCEKPFLTTS